MAELVPWHDAREIKSTVQINIRRSYTLAELTRERSRGAWAAFEDYCQKQPKKLFWGSVSAVGLLLSLFALIFSTRAEGLTALMAAGSIRFGLVLAALSAFQLLRKGE